ARIGVVDVEARDAADRGDRSGAWLGPELGDSELDRVAEEDVARIIALRTAVLEVEVGEAVRKDVLKVRMGTGDAAKIFDVRARVERGEHDRLAPLPRPALCV